MKKIETLWIELLPVFKEMLTGMYREHFFEGDGVQHPSASKGLFEEICAEYHLTKREVEIASLVCKGYSYRRIADLLYISPRTVSKHVEHIFEKAKVNNKIGLIQKLHKFTD